MVQIELTKSNKIKQQQRKYPVVPPQTWLISLTRALRQLEKILISLDLIVFLHPLTKNRLLARTRC